MDTILTIIHNLWLSTGIYGFIQEPLQLVMIFLALILLFLAIKKGFEPLLLLPIGFGALLTNIPLAGIATHSETIIEGGKIIVHHGGFLGQIVDMGITNEFFPLIIFMGVGAMTDFGPLIANPITALLGGAAQFGIFATVFGTIALAHFGFDFSLKDAASIGIIGGADGPTSIFLSAKLKTPYFGAIAVAAYTYMALVPLIQPPFMKLFTTKSERKIKMNQLRTVSKREKILFPLLIAALTMLFIPESMPLIGALTFGNLAKTTGVVDRLSDTMQNSLINITTIFLGLGVGTKLYYKDFLRTETLLIIVLGLAAFSVGTISGLLMAKIMNVFRKDKINPLIGSAGVSAVPMAARVSNKVGIEADPNNFLLMHAMGPNVAGVIGSAVAAGVLLSLLG